MNGQYVVRPASGYCCPHCDYKTACRQCFGYHRTTCGIRSVPSPRSFKRAAVGEDAYCDLLDTIDPGAEQ